MTRIEYEKKLRKIFPHAMKLPVGVLYAKLHRLEAEAHTLATRECNEQLPEGYAERKCASIKARLAALLGESKVPIFINTDPRGYALKVEDAYVKAHSLDIERDWGGYGLICPEIRRG